MKKTIVLIMDGVRAAIVIAFIVVVIVNINSDKKNEEALETLRLERQVAEEQRKAEEALNSDTQEENWDVPSETTQDTDVADAASDTTPDATPNTAPETNQDTNQDTTQTDAVIGGANSNITDCILPDSNTKEYTKEELEEIFKDKDKEQIELAMYEIYARHDCRFDGINDNKVQGYFDAVDGYQARQHINDFDVTLLNDVEKKNIDTLKSMVE